jgi:uncharacterized GH25 family protein
MDRSAQGKTTDCSRKRTLSLVILSLCLGILAPLNGHEFWLYPQRFQLSTGQAVRLRFQVGEDFQGENWTGNRASVTQLKLFWKQYDDDLRTLVSDTFPGDSLTLQFFDEGTVMVAFESTDKFIQLDPAAFNAYLEEDGITHAIAYRREHQETDSAGREFYRRSVKTIFQVGAARDNIHQKATGLPVDIIPLAHPYSLKKGDQLPVKVLFKGEPLRNYLVRSWQRLNGKTTRTDLQTDSTGQVRIPVSLAGQWMVSTVPMERLSGDTAQWRSYWGSLTWGYE